MLRPEARWLRRAFAGLPTPPGTALLNVGSSTGYYRHTEQPWVDQEVFAPLVSRGVSVVHLDLKPDEGVDLVGDLLDPAFRAEALSGQYGLVLCSNLLEHVRDRNSVCRALQDVLPAGGHLLVTCPRSYPYHPDPIDTMFRPDVSALAGLFPQLEVVDGQVVKAELQWSYFAHYEVLAGRGSKSGTLHLARAALRQREERQRLLDCMVATSATCVVLRKR